MKVTGIDERNVTSERIGGSFVVFIYEGGDGPSHSWSVDSHLLTETSLPRVFEWLAENLPVNCCWSLGIVEHLERPTSESDVQVSWVVGADVLNLGGSQREPAEQRLADEMIARRHHLTLRGCHEGRR